MVGCNSTLSAGNKPCAELMMLPTRQSHQKGSSGMDSRMVGRGLVA